MNTNIISRSPFLRTSREYPEDLHQLSLEMNKSYVDIAIAVNNRTIGIFPVNFPILTGESWFLSNNQKQDTLRQVYTFGAITAGGPPLTIPYTINGLFDFSRIFGTCKTSQPDSRPIPYASVAANGNIDLRVDTVNNNIVIAVGAGSPNIISGRVVLEWLSYP